MRHLEEMLDPQNLSEGLGGSRESDKEAPVKKLRAPPKLSSRSGPGGGTDPRASGAVGENVTLGSRPGKWCPEGRTRVGFLEGEILQSFGN